MTTTWLLWLTINLGLMAIAYLLGATPSGYWAGRWLKGIDIRNQGSGSTGATNVLRTIGKGPALVVFVVDLSKGAIAIALARLLYPIVLAALISTETMPTIMTPLPWLPWLSILAGMMALLGHSKSIWINFTGGKSVASGLGILLILDWRVGLLTLMVFAIVLGISRIVSLGSIIAAIAVGVLMLWLNPILAYGLFAIVGGLYVIYRHTGNIQRLLAGTEPRIGEKPLQNPQP